MSSSAVSVQLRWLVWRSLVRTLRQPANIVPPLAFPLLLLAINASGLQAATTLPGFPTDSYLTFALAVPFLQGATFSLINAGSDLARDVETGFLNRLALTPMWRGAVLVGQLGGVLATALLCGIGYLLVGLAFGADFAAGIAGVPVLFALLLVLTLAFAAVGSFVALRAGSGEAVQGVFPVTFVFLFLSSMNLPRPLMEQDWFRAIATYNPVSYFVEGIRSLFITGWDERALALGFGLAALLAVVAVLAASRALDQRLVRT